MTHPCQHIPPAMVARIDQCRAETAKSVREMAAEFKRVADAHDGTTLCAHGQMASALFHRWEARPAVADLFAGAFVRIYELERELAELRGEQ